MNVGVELFAQARDLAGASLLQVEVPSTATVADLKASLGEQVPALRPLLPHLLVAIDNSYASGDSRLREGSTIACFPPVSGG